MKKTLTLITLASAFVLFILPFSTVKLAEAQDGMGLILILMLIVNPLTVVITGAACGRKIKSLWWFPIAFSALFLGSYWLVLEEIILDLTIYACIYLILGFLSLLISHLVVLKTSKK